MTEIRPSKKEIIQAEYKKMMLEAAERVLLRRGFRATTMDEIAREASFSKATVYKYFPNKGWIIMEIILQYIDELSRCLQEIQKSTLSPEEKLKRMINSVLEIQARKENISRLFLQDRSLHDFFHRLFADPRGSESHDYRQALELFKEKREEIYRTGCQVVAEGIKSGLFKKMKPETILRYVWALVEGLLHTRYWQDERIEPKEETEQVFRFLMGGIAREPLKKGVRE
ncbi:MAG: TetR/AcrR family transcriptional regulator [Candidatus Saccharicenans sp.]|nr:TetR/AcrR family transcriptional regulator [Candidatus Saccharicenans sp.]